MQFLTVREWMVMRMTCKDCIHIDVCNEHEILMHTVNNLYELMYQEGVDKSCKHFRNKADFVEVVRCKDCRHANDCGTICHYGVGRDVKPDHFCGYGEKKEEDI